jgi:hypothetical protein
MLSVVLELSQVIRHGLFHWPIPRFFHLFQTVFALFLPYLSSEKSRMSAAPSAPAQCGCKHIFLVRPAQNTKGITNFSPQRKHSSSSSWCCVHVHASPIPASSNFCLADGWTVGSVTHDGRFGSKSFCVTILITLKRTCDLGQIKRDALSTELFPRH